MVAARRLVNSSARPLVRKMLQAGGPQRARSGCRVERQAGCASWGRQRRSRPAAAGAPRQSGSSPAVAERSRCSRCRRDAISLRDHVEVRRRRRGSSTRRPSPCRPPRDGPSAASPEPGRRGEHRPPLAAVAHREQVDRAVVRARRRAGHAPRPPDRSRLVPAGYQMPLPGSSLVALRLLGRPRARRRPRTKPSARHGARSGQCRPARRRLHAATSPITRAFPAPCCACSRGRGSRCSGTASGPAGTSRRAAAAGRAGRGTRPAAGNRRPAWPQLPAAPAAGPPPRAQAPRGPRTPRPEAARRKPSALILPTIVPSLVGLSGRCQHHRSKDDAMIAEAYIPESRLYALDISP